MSDIAIKINNICKIYRLGLRDERPDTLTATALSWLKTPFKNLRRLQELTRLNADEQTQDILWALRDISFEVKTGEVVGIIGKNGAGKSTLLKILSRITEPSSGRAEVSGRVGSLLEVGTGFHPEMTGRENIYMNGTILGMTKKEIDRKFDEIVDFSGVEKFLDTPIKRYSSGMSVRLAFSVAAHLEPEVLIIDEVLAVGDMEFQRKCLGKMQNLAGEGRTVLFVSHQLEAVSNLCNKAILLRKGQIVAQGNQDEIIELYMKEMSNIPMESLSERKDRKGHGRVKFTETWMETQDGKVVDRIKIGESVNIKVRFEVHDAAIKSMITSIAISTAKNIKVCDLKNIYIDEPFGPDLPQQGLLTCSLSGMNLNHGTYYYNLFCASEFGYEDWVMNASAFDIEPSDFYGTGRLPEKDRLCLMNYRWSIE